MTEKLSPRIKTIIFDMDGTLYSFPKSKTLYMSYKLWHDRKLLYHLRIIRAKMRQEVYADHAHFKNALYQQLAQRARVSPDYAREWYENVFWSAFITMLKERVAVRPQLSAFLSECHDQEVKLVILSDYDHITERLKALNIAEAQFDLLLSCEEFGQLKPAPISFLAAMESCHSAPEETLIVGDTPAYDENGATAVGANFLGLSDRKITPPGYYHWEEAMDKIKAMISDSGTADGG